MRALLAALALAIAAAAAPTHVTGSIANADNTRPTGFLILSWTTFSSNTTLYKSGSITKPVTNGTIDLWLEPGYYTAQWGGSRGVETMTIYVPTSSTAVDINACLLTDTTKLAVTQLAPSGAIEGQILGFHAGVWAPINAPTGTGGSGGGSGPWPISSVTGLQPALDAHTAAIAAETTNRTNAITGEASARSAADTTNAGAIAAHTTRTDNPHQVTAAQTGAASTAALAAETTARQADTTNTTAAIASEATTRAAAITAEATTRSTADAANTAAIAAIRPYQQTWTAANTGTMPASAHGLGSLTNTAQLTCYDQTTSTLFIPLQWTIDTNYNVSITFGLTLTGPCTLRP